MTAALLDVPAGVGLAIADEVRRYGALGVETGGFLLASEGTGAVRVVAFAGTAGIIRHRLQLQISEIALDRLFAFAEEQGCWVPAQFHSHAGEAFLSQADREYGLRVPGFISAVIPGFADPPARPDAWTWWRFDGTEWNPARSPEAGRRDMLQVVFDEDGVRDR
jgi:proteasome lid subunit RPN8/RPN11